MSKRLTKRKEYGCACWNGDQNLVTHKRYSELLDALARYEDVIFDADGGEIISIARLRELADAEKDGRVVVLPNCNLCERRCEKNGISETACDICFGNELHNKASNHFKPDRALTNATNQVDRCMTCDNNGKPICSSCIMTGHGNDIDFYRAATEPKGEHHD